MSNESHHQQKIILQEVVKTLDEYLEELESRIAYYHEVKHSGGRALADAANRLGQAGFRLRWAILDKEQE